MEIKPTNPCICTMKKGFLEDGVDKSSREDISIFEG